MIFSYVAACFSLLALFLGLVVLLRQPSTNAEQQPQHDQHDSIRLARLANESSSSHQTLTLQDGRSLGFAVYGSSSGPTTFFLHGFGDCRLTAALFDEPGKKFGARVIGVDRPGWGLSSIQPGRTALNFVDDLRQLATYLEIKEYSTIGVSGGGPYVLACAYSLPAEQLKSVTMLCATGPWNMTTRHSRWVTWLVWEVRRLSPTIQRWMDLASLRKYRDMTCEQFISTTKSQTKGWLVRLMGLHLSDLALFQDDEFLALMFDGLKENCNRDIQGAIEEWRVMTTSDLGFSLDRIRRDLPIELWYGKHDSSVSWRVGESLKASLGGRARLHVRDEAHLSILVNCRFEVLEKALESMQK